MTCRDRFAEHKRVTLRVIDDGRIASERLKNVREDRRSTLEDCVRKNTGQKKQTCKNCEGKRHPQEGRQDCQMPEVRGTGIKP